MTIEKKGMIEVLFFIPSFSRKCVSRSSLNGIKYTLNIVKNLILALKAPQITLFCCYCISQFLPKNHGGINIQCGAKKINGGGIYDLLLFNNHFQWQYFNGENKIINIRGMALILKKWRMRFSIGFP